MKLNQQEIIKKSEEIKKIILQNDYERVFDFSKSDYINFVLNNEKFDKYTKNYLALLYQNPALAIRLFEKNQGDYEIFMANDNEINIINKNTLKALLKNPKEHKKEWQERFCGDLINHKVLFFYGIGLGEIAAYDFINTQKIIIFEDDLNILYIALNLQDLCKKIFNKTIEIYDKNISRFDISMLLENKDIKTYIKLYDLLIYSDFYDDFKDEIIKINDTLTKSFSIFITSNGNSSIDALWGIQNFMINIPDIIKNYPFQKLLQKAKQKCHHAVIVSTGPSLTKQLPLLKQYQDKIYIISVDASFKILIENDIIPDFVTSLERIPQTSAFFNFDFKEKAKNTFIVPLALTHENTIKFLNEQNAKYSLCLKSLPFELGFDLKDYGSMGIGLSAANIALELAIKLECKNIVFIGQDLAFDSAGNSHAKGHKYGENERSKEQSGVYVKGWYGNFIETRPVWNVFREQLENVIDYFKNINYYNCTQGGAWIEGCKHIAFNDFLKQIKNSPKKSQISIVLPEQNDIKQNLEKVKNHIERLYAFEKENLFKFKNIFLQIAQICDRLQNDEKSVSLKELVVANDKINALKDIVESEEFCKFYMEILQSRMIHFELDLVVIAAINAKTQEEKIKKMIEWIKAHKVWIFHICGTIEILGDNVRAFSLNLIKELKNHGFCTKILENEYNNLEKSGKKIQKITHL